MNKIFLVGIIIGIGLPVTVIGSLYEIQISTRNSEAFPFFPSQSYPPQNGFAMSDHNVTSTSDLCSPQFTVYRGSYGSLSTMPCLEQINLKLDKLISLEEQENKP